MGQRQGKRGACAEDPPCLVDLNPMPDELLVEILSWVPGRTLVTRCRLVCRRWRALVDSAALWTLLLRRAPSKRALLEATLEAARQVPRMEWGRMVLREPFGRNLVRNPCGRERFRHWTIHHAGGDGWGIEPNRHHVEGAEAQTCFVSSYSWCTKSQMVDLLQEGLWEDLLDTYQPDICIYDWWGAREDCACVYRICVKLLAADKSSVIAEFTAEPDPIPQWNNEEYQQVSHVFRNYGPGVRYVHLFHKAKDTQYWAGRYGARITNSTVLVKAARHPL